MKIKKFLSYLWGMETQVLTCFYYIIPPFLSYLWGMETLFRFCQILSFLVLILPMRNGNPPHIFFLLSYLVLILPMRNGNSKSIVRRWNSFIVLILPMRNGNNIRFDNSGFFSSRSYPTYEEWKPPCLLNILYLFPVLILPMRNGNNL